MKWNWSVIFQQVHLTQSDELLQTVRQGTTGLWFSVLLPMMKSFLIASRVPFRYSIVGFSGWVAQFVPEHGHDSSLTLRIYIDFYHLSVQSLATATHGHTQYLIPSHPRAFPDHLLMTSFARSRTCLACNSYRAFRSLAESNLPVETTKRAEHHPSTNHVRQKNASSTKRTNIIQLLCHPQLLKNEIFMISPILVVRALCVASWSYTLYKVRNFSMIQNDLLFVPHVP